MRYIATLVAVASAAALFVGFSAAPAKPDAPVGDTSAAPFAVVELFTSEGCSSCPPADQNLDAIAARAKANGKAVYALAYHVDYWDRLGWKDPFGSPSYTKRQGEYVRAMGKRQLYTPQMVVNGREEFVGSSRGKARSAIDAALSDGSTVSLTATVKQAGQDWLVSYTVEGAPKGLVAVAALTERGHAIKVTRGENSGETLRHDHPVRALAQAPLLGKAGTLKLSAASVDPNNAEVIVFAQDPKSMVILGATRAR